MPVPTLITELSPTAASNSPVGSESPGILDDYQRAHAAFIAQLRNGKADLAGSATQAFATSLLKVGSESAAPWSSATRAVDIGPMSAIFHLPTGVAGVTRNLYTDDDGFNWRYRTTGMAQLLYLGANGEVSIYTAPSAGGAGTVAGLSNRHNVSNTGVVTFGANRALHTGNVFHGRIYDDGSVERLPPGWSSSKLGTGYYRITHNLGTAGYSLTFGGTFTNVYAMSPVPRGINSFDVQTTSAAAVSADMAFNFSLMLDA